MHRMFAVCRNSVLRRPIKSENTPVGSSNSDEGNLRDCENQNGLRIRTGDLREVHDHHRSVDAEVVAEVEPAEQSDVAARGTHVMHRKRWSAQAFRHGCPQPNAAAEVAHAVSAKLQRRSSAKNLVAALRAGAACEVDLTFTADGHALCLHDATLTARRPDTAVLRRDACHDSNNSANECYWRGVNDYSLFLDEVCDTVASVGVAAPALVQLDVKARAQALSVATCETFARTLGNRTDAFIASAYDWDAVTRLWLPHADCTPGSIPCCSTRARLTSMPTHIAPSL